MAGFTFNPVITASLGDNNNFNPVEGGSSDATWNQQLCQAGQFGLQTMQEIMALNGGGFALYTLRAWYAMNSFSGVVGQAVRFDPANPYSVLPANSTDAAHSAICGFIRTIQASAPTNCAIAFAARVTGLSGLTENAPVYLQDSGAIGATPGTYPRIVGRAMSTTDALVSPFRSEPVTGWTSPSNTQTRNAATLTTATDACNALAALVADLKKLGILAD